jgi:hypothetical protein
MKLLLALMLLTLGICVGNAQGIVAFANSSAEPVVDYRTGQPVVTGNTFLAGLYFAQDGITDESQFVQVGPAADFWQPGVFNGGGRTAPTTVPGGYGMFQVRAWESAFGSSYEEAASAPPQGGRLALIGKSGIFRADTSGSIPPTKPPTTIIAQGFRGFHVTPVPEPATALLFGVAFTLGTCLLSTRRIYHPNRNQTKFL